MSIASNAKRRRSRHTSGKTSTVYILDTDALSMYFTQADCQLRARVDTTPPEELGVSIVTVMEILAPAMSMAKKLSGTDRAVFGFDLLLRMVENLRLFQIVPYEEDARILFLNLPQNIRQHHGNDCRIASTAMARNGTVVTMNTQDYSRIDGCRFENWNAGAPL